MKLRDDLGHAEETNSFTLSTRGDSECRRQMCFPGSAVADQKKVFVLVDVLALHQLRHQHFVKRRLRFEVECVECLVIRELRIFQPTFGCSLIAVN